MADQHPKQLLAAARTILDSDPEMKLVLVPHVIRPEGDPESDWEACRNLELQLDQDYEGRVVTLPQTYGATELKWVISQFDWFAGARMHATIAGFSSGVPTLGLGYSDKAEGVFTQCGLEQDVVDLRRHDANGIATAVGESLSRRLATRDQLDDQLASVFRRATDQMDKIVEAIRVLED